MANRNGALEELAAIVQHSSDAIFSRTFGGVITTWNAAAERIFGFKAEEITGRSSQLLLPRGHREEFRALVARMRRGEIIESFETERIRKNGERLRVQLTLSPIRDSSGRLVEFSTIARDVTESERTRLALARSQRELADLFQEASVGLIVLSRHGRVFRANPAFLELIDCTVHQITGHELRPFFAEPGLFTRLLRRLALRQTFHNFPAELRTAKGQAKSVLIDANALWEGGRFVQSRWFIRDISKRKLLERELIELSDRERRNLAQELHDGLGQQLGGVAYLTNVLRGKLLDREAPETAEATRIFDLVRDAIAQTRRVARGLSPIRPDPEGLMDALREFAEQTTQLYGINCRFSCDKRVLVTNEATATHLFRIAQEATNNALKHAKARSITIMLTQSSLRIRLKIADDGKGIGPLSPKREGLGLRIMQYRAGLIQGTLVVRRRGKRGTVVESAAPHRLSTGV